jgi:hypothetical protein
MKPKQYIDAEFGVWFPGVSSPTPLAGDITELGRAIIPQRSETPVWVRNVPDHWGRRDSWVASSENTNYFCFSPFLMLSLVLALENSDKSYVLDFTRICKKTKSKITHNSCSLEITTLRPFAF